MKVAVLICVTLVVTGLAVALANLCLGVGHTLPALVAVGLCLPTAMVTLVLAEVVTRKTPDFGPIAILIGTGMRMTVAVLGVVVLGEFMTRAGVDRERFAGWVAFLYLTTLITESALLIRSASEPVKPAGAP